MQNIEKIQKQAQNLLKEMEVITDKCPTCGDPFIPTKKNEQCDNCNIVIFEIEEERRIAYEALLEESPFLKESKFLQELK